MDNYFVEEQTINAYITNLNHLINCEICNKKGEGTYMETLITIDYSRHLKIYCEDCYYKEYGLSDIIRKYIISKNI
jgi:hypothetical protein